MLEITLPRNCRVVTHHKAHTGDGTTMLRRSIIGEAKWMLRKRPHNTQSWPPIVCSYTCRYKLAMDAPQSGNQRALSHLYNDVPRSCTAT